MLSHTTLRHATRNGNPHIGFFNPYGNTRVSERRFYIGLQPCSSVIAGYLLKTMQHVRNNRRAKYLPLLPNGVLQTEKHRDKNRNAVRRGKKQNR